jgi:hypothetical protein
MKPLNSLFLIIFSFSSLALRSQNEQTSPSFTKDIVIYEIAPKAFTSPYGPESGTFRSMMNKLPYLKKLGINTIWLTGHNWADNAHFYGIWTQYATIRPDSIDPTLGTTEDFKLLVKTSHKNGLRIVLDVITHGVMANSPLIKLHQEWFKGGSWGMTDYDWKGGHKDLDDWWVKTCTDYVLKYGVDGYRLDVSIYRPDLWKSIRQICARSGHPIVVFDEGGDPFNEDALDFYQHHSPSMGKKETNTDFKILYTSDVAGSINSDTVKQNFYYSNQLSCHDSGWQGFPEKDNPYVAQGSRYLFGYSILFVPSIPVFMAGEEFNAAFKPLPRLSPDLYGKVAPGTKSKWLYGAWIQWDQLDQPDKRAMLEDVQRMLAIRTSEKDIIHAIKPGDKDKHILSVKVNSTDGKIPVPYLMWNKNKALLVAANPSTEKDIELNVNIPLEDAGFKQNKFKVTNLWTEGKRILMTRDELKKFSFKILKDKQPKGGVVIYKIEGI